MKFFTPLTAIIAAASAGQVYSDQPTENYANLAQIHQSQLAYPLQGLYSGQPHAFVSDAAYNNKPIAKNIPRILSYISETDGHSYQYSFETENGIKTQEAGQEQGKGVTAQGAFSYTGDDGHEYTVSYTADEHGFRAHGVHLPTAPPTPDAILKALEQNARDEAAGVYDDGHYEEPKYTNTVYEQGGHHAEQAVTQSSSVHHHKKSS